MLQRLPQPDDLIVEQVKLMRYLLDASHPDGVSKARFFKSLGFSLLTWRLLAAALIEHGQERDVIEETQNAFGTKYFKPRLWADRQKSLRCAARTAAPA